MSSLFGASSTISSQNNISSLPSEALPQKGRILLVGSGPGHPSLLTIAAHTALTQWANLVLSDKLVPDKILSLIPKHVSVRIANKLPGNVEVAQIEMMEAAVEAANKGLTVVRVRSRISKTIKSFV
jgi:uroporphyrin-III C-methyltransferase